MARYEVLAGIERRRRWSDEEKRRIIAEAFSCREGVSSVARRHEIYPQQIYRWRREFGLGAGVSVDEPRFLAISVAPDSESGVTTDCAVPVEIVCLGGRALRVAGSIGDARLQHLIRLVETA